MQEVIVGLIVVGAAAYAAWYWLPVAWRHSLGTVHPALSQAPGCGACESSCSGCAKSDPPKASAGDRRVIPIVAQKPAPHSD
jgi:hypothetical protein